MKGNSQFTILLLILFLSSCSNLTSRKSLFGDENEPAKGSAKTVPKSQYDELLKKYEILMKQSRDANVNGTKMENVPNVDKDVFDQKRPGDLVSALNKLEGDSAKGSSADLAETVDVFKKPDEPKGINKVAPVVMPDYSKVDVGSQITKYRKAVDLMNQNKFDAALNEFKLLENSAIRQVRVRAKFNIGELLFKQKEYDLSMQVFEEILQKDAFSGLVIKALGRLIVCSSKLKLKKKEEQYYSVLHDFFEES